LKPQCFRWLGVELEGLNVRPDQAVGEYAAAMRLLDGKSLKEAVSFYIDHNPTKNSRITTGEIVKEFIASKKDAAASPHYLRDLHTRTTSLVRKLGCELSQLTPGKLGDYFRKLNFSGQNHNNQMRVLTTLFKFAKTQGYLSEATDLLKAVSKKKVRKGSYCIYQPEEFAALLRGGEWRHAAALGTAGLLRCPPCRDASPQVGRYPLQHTHACAGRPANQDSFTQNSPDW
jgi:hypothetical protein